MVRSSHTNKKSCWTRNKSEPLRSLLGWREKPTWSERKCMNPRTKQLVDTEWRWTAKEQRRHEERVANTVLERMGMSNRTGEFAQAMARSRTNHGGHHFASTKRSQRKSRGQLPRKSARKSARKPARKSARKSRGRKSARKSRRQVSRKSRRQVPRKSRRRVPRKSRRRVPRKSQAKSKRSYRVHDWVTAKEEPKELEKSWYEYLTQESASVIDEFGGGVGGSSNIYSQDQDQELEHLHYIDRQRLLRKFDELYKKQYAEYHEKQLEACYNNAINACNKKILEPSFVADKPLESAKKRAQRDRATKEYVEHMLRNAAAAAVSKAGPLKQQVQSSQVVDRSPQWQTGPVAHFPGVEKSSDIQLMASGLRPYTVGPAAKVTSDVMQSLGETIGSAIFDDMFPSLPPSQLVASDTSLTRSRESPAVKSKPTLLKANSMVAILSMLTEYGLKQYPYKGPQKINNFTISQRQFKNYIVNYFKNKNIIVVPADITRYVNSFGSQQEQNYLSMIKNIPNDLLENIFLVLVQSLGKSQKHKKSAERYQWVLPILQKELARRKLRINQSKQPKQSWEVVVTKYTQIFPRM